MTDNDGENRLIAERRAKLSALREKVDQLNQNAAALQRQHAFPNDFKRDSLAAELLAAYGAHSAESLAADKIAAAVAGRLMVKRVMGGSTFLKIQDRSGQIQLFVRRDRLGEASHAEVGRDLRMRRAASYQDQDRRSCRSTPRSCVCS
jgi:lysyl-tRNA synthetase class 2